MVKAYLRYEQSALCGVVSSARGGGGVAFADADGAAVAVAAVERVNVWSVRAGELAASLAQEGNTSGVGGQERLPECTSLLALAGAHACSDRLLIAGYADGHVRVWESDGGCRAQLRGHRRPVTALAGSVDGAALASGAADGDVVVWDALADAGVCRLKGHRGQVTCLAFLEAYGAHTAGRAGSSARASTSGGASGAWLASGSKDGMVRVWHVATRHCVQVLQAWRGEVWSLALHPEGERLVVGTGDEYLRLFDVDVAAGEALAAAAVDADAALARREGDAEPAAGTKRKGGGGDGEDDGEGENGGEGERAERFLGGIAGSLVGAATDVEVLRESGRLKRSAAAGTHRASALEFSADGLLLAAASSGRLVELYRVLDGAAAQRRAKRRVKRAKEKAAKRKAALKGELESLADGDPQLEELEAELAEAERELAEGVHAVDTLQLQAAVTTKARVAGVAFAEPGGPWAPRKGGTGKGDSSKGVATQRLAVALSNNSVEIVHVSPPADKGDEGVELAHTLDAAGHRADVRAVALSADDRLLVTASSGLVKVWPTDAKSGAPPTATMSCGYALCTLVAPGGRFAVVGTKSGSLQVFDLGAAAMVDEVEAHKGECWSIATMPDGSGLVSGGADRRVRFWEYAVTQPSGGAASITLRESKSMSMSDDVLSVRFGGSGGKYLAVSLLDSTVKVFFADTLKFFLSLYGHKLPVLCMDASDDGALLATGGADKNVKLWGLDFGDCHRSLFAHDGSVMGVAFVPRTHYLFSVGKDGSLKYWDADKFELLLTLEGHHSQVWGLTVSSRGDFVVTAGADKSVRRWVRTDEPFFIEEERERKMDSLFEAEGAGGGGEGAVLEGALAPASNPEMDASLAGRRTGETADAADKIIEALDMAATEEKRLTEAATEGADKAGAANPLMLGMGPDPYLLRTVRSVRASELEQALLVLPFEHAMQLVGFLARMLRAGGAHVELCAKAATTIARLHHDQLSGAHAARSALEELRDACRPAAQRLRDTMGLNLAAVRIIQQRIEADRAGLLGAAEERVAQLRAASARMAAVAAGGATLGTKAGAAAEATKSEAGRRRKSRRLA